MLITVSCSLSAAVVGFFSCHMYSVYVDDATHLMFSFCFLKANKDRTQCV